MNNIKKTEKSILTIKSLNKSFGEKILFRDLNINFKNCGIYAISGASGIGKTTLLRIIAGLDKDYTGQVIKQGKVAFVFQEYRLFDNLNAIDNITEILCEKPTAEDRIKAKEFLVKLRFTEAETKLYPSELSGGMKQRVSIARALLSDAEIVILDEATKELDNELVKAVLDILKAEAKKRLIILVTHKPEDIVWLSAEQIML